MLDAGHRAEIGAATARRRPGAAPLVRPSFARGLSALAITLLVLLVAGRVAYDLPGVGRAEFTAHTFRGAGDGLDGPSPSPEEAATPLGSPAAPAAETGEYAFMATQAGGAGPVAYDPCRPVHVVLSTHDLTPGRTVLVKRALHQVAAATGLRFVIDGTTDEEYSRERDSYQPQRYGDRWAPVLVSFQDPSDNPGLAGRVAGMGGSRLGTDAGHRFWVTGAISLDAGFFGSLDYSSAEKVAVIMHEFGHVVGLDHVSDAAELMAATNDGQTSFGPGDLAGLAVLGRGACAPGL